MEGFNVEDAIQQTFIIGAIKNFMPDAPKYYPAIDALINNLQKDFADYLGDSKKIAFAMRKNNQTRIIVIDATKPFSFDSENGFQGSEGSLLVNQEVQEFVNNRIMSNPIFAWFKEEYEAKYKGNTDSQDAMTLITGGQ